MTAGIVASDWLTYPRYRKKMKYFVIFMCLTLGYVTALSPSSYITGSNIQHFKTVLDASWTLEDVQQVFYSVGGYKHLKLPVPNKENVCSFIKKSIKEPMKLETIYFTFASSKYLDCSLSAPTSVKQVVTDSIRDDASAKEIFYAVLSASSLNIPIDSVKVLRALQHALKKDDSVVNLGYSFHVASELKGDVRPIFERIEDAIVQADEIDGTMLQFEGGLSTTALVLSGAYRLAEAAKKPIPLKSDQVVKFANYLMSRKSVQIPKGVFYLLNAVTMLTDNKYHIPVAITLESNVAVSAGYPKVQVKVTNLLGEDLGALKVIALSAKEVSTGTVLLENMPLKKFQNQKSTFELDIMSLKPVRGFYQLVLSAEGGDSRLVGHQKAMLVIKVLTSVELDGVEFGTADSDQTSAPNLKRLTHPNKLTSVVEADQHQKLVLKFSVKDLSSGKAARIHQAFVKITHLGSQREIIFVAEPDNNNIYKFDMDVHSRRKDFGLKNGKYSMELIIGDPAISNPMIWHFADVGLTFPDGKTTEPTSDYTYKALPEIHHVFRTPDSRPSKIVSLAFTALSLFPLIILLAGWIKLGVNLSNFSLTLSGLGFHFGLGGIFGLFFMFWLKLNMFTTLKYLAIIGIFTFTCGNLMLARIAARRKTSIQ